MTTDNQALLGLTPDQTATLESRNRQILLGAAATGVAIGNTIVQARAANEASKERRTDLILRGAAAMRARNIQARRLVGRQKAIFAAAGVDVGSGSVPELFASTAAEEARNVALAGDPFFAAARAARSQGDAAISAGVGQVAGTIVSSGTRFALLRQQNRDSMASIEAAKKTAAASATRNIFRRPKPGELDNFGILRSGSN
jgi:hypothetical protein